MAKRNASDRLDPEGLNWLDDQIEDSALDPKALAAMPLRDVKSALNRHDATDTRAFLQSLNERLPEGTEIPEPQRRTRSDRAPEPMRPARRPLRLVSWRGLAAVFLLLVAVSVAVPYAIKNRNAIQAELSMARTLIDGLDWDNLPDSAVIGPDVADMRYGVRYMVLDFPGRIPLTDVLPENRGDDLAYFEMSIRIDASGKVTELHPVNFTSQAMSAGVVEAILNWQFDSVDVATPVQPGRIIVVYEPE